MGDEISVSDFSAEGFEQFSQRLRDATAFLRQSTILLRSSLRGL